MSDPTADRPGGALRQHFARWNSWAAALLRAASLALAALLLAYAGAFSLNLAPWSAMALPAGLLLAAHWRGGYVAWAGSLLGLFVALLGLGLSLGACAAAVLTLALFTHLAHRLLRSQRFDMRLQRPSDVAALAVTGVFVVALPTALVLGAAMAILGGRDAFASVLTGWTALSLGAVAGGAAVLALDRSLLQTGQRGAPGWRSAGALALLLVATGLGLLAASSRSSPALSAAALLVPPVCLVVLALREQFTWASGGFVITGLLGASSVGRGHFLGLSESTATPMLAVWLGTTLGLVLLVHGSTAHWRSRSQRWEWALDGSRLGVADWHLELEENFASDAWRTLTTHTSGHWSPTAWRQRVHPDDQARLDEAIQALSEGKAGRREFEVRMPAGSSWRWAEVTLLVIERDGAGHPLRLLATLADVHERREAREHQRMSASLFQHLHEGLLITDADLRALDVNPAYTQILGVTRDDLLGSVPSLLLPSPADPVARQQRAAMWASLRDHGSWRGELLERRRDGRLCTLQVTISTVHAPDDDGVQGLRYHVLVISDITEQLAQRDRLERQAHFDELTRLPNRSQLSRLLDEAMRATDKEGDLLVVCYLDLDHFKPVNDLHGHAAGDRLLSELADRLRLTLRSREHWTDSAARLGGDEFVLLLRAGTLEEGRMAVERVLRVVSQPYVVGSELATVMITASVGATVYPIDRSDADTLLRHADHAMYGAKQAGRNGYLFFDPEHRRRNEQRVMAIGRIQEALDRQEFVLHYQPKVDMRSGRVLGFEALLRWEHPEQGLVPPLQFLPLIEHTGLSASIGDWVIARALEHLANWRRDGLDFSVSVNVSARHLQEPDFALRLAELLARHDEPLARHLEVEMLETAAHADIEATSALVARCQALGVRFGLDDFGTGYSTLTYLKRLPVDVLKIDRSFVHQMLDNPQDRAIVEGVIGLARTFNCTVVAEGVETPAQARALLELGCDIGQGSGIATAMPVEQVAAWVREYRGVFALVPAPAANDPPGASAHGAWVDSGG